MLRWTLGITLLDHVCNDTFRARMKVAPIVKKMQEKRLRWYRHVSRRDENHQKGLCIWRSLEKDHGKKDGRIRADLKELRIDEHYALENTGDS
ncbi:unnamed protein product [Strongylus vulgaris]|uniref:Uncharacterized protein n=1 Tax=Strongylus vulgaris TaxID=40348 RepID=A0A3P7JGC9_STRVU|nr:unnamed protein product [Strongylus vulgaris]